MRAVCAVSVLLVGCLSTSGLNALPTDPVSPTGTGPTDAPVDDPPAPPPPVPANCEGFGARFESALAVVEAELAASGIPGASFAAACGGQVLSAGVGVVRPGGAPVTSTTRFQIASITKALTATATLELAAAGVVELHQPVGLHLPTLAYGDEVTLHHLLTHTSGLETGFYSWNADGLTASTLANPNLARWAEPGDVWNYNNYAYAVAGAVLETASGQTFAALMDARVFGPLGMPHATMRISDVIAGEYAWGHSGSPSNPQEIGPQGSYYGAGWYGPMGGAWATAEDLVRFGVALGQRGELTAQWVGQTPTGESATQQYGYGLFVEPMASPAWVHHGGGVAGFTASFEAVPQAGVAVALLVNADWDIPNGTSALIDQLVDFGPGTAGTGPAANNRIVGTYDSEVFGQVTVRAQGAGLVMDFAADGSSVPMSRWSHNTFDVSWSGESWGPIPITAWDEGSGPIEYLVSPWGIARRQ